MLLKILVLTLTLLSLALPSDSHVGDTAHLHCTSCGNLAHSGGCPSDENFWVGLGKNILSDLLPGSSSTDHVINSRDPHTRYPNGYAENFSNFMASITVVPLTNLLDDLLADPETCSRCGATYKGSHYDCIANSTGY